MKRVNVVVASAAAAFVLGSLAGCTAASQSDPQPEPEPTRSAPSMGVFTVSTVDVNGRKIVCVTWDGKNTSGLSCDWVSGVR